MSEGKAREFWIWTSDSGKKCKHIFDTKEAAFNRATKHSAMACGVSQLIRESEFESLKKENEALKAKLEASITRIKFDRSEIVEAVEEDRFNCSNHKQYYKTVIAEIDMFLSVIEEK